ncbi:ABC transporter ATP-binding protein [uncultured Photobacterium sp.]|uniref:ABC transporter ATP-binding protein n=1 Tax=uncultured Photobacterium sp. TaxID=173973 RepID=UPI002639BA5C|nr:ATP-binding cassette domain-containing protein [uncultured Photobacterium sp.]
MIEFQRIQKKYGPNVLAGEALKGVDGRIDNGEAVALYGPSGAGKSALLNICGLLDCDYKGRVIIGDNAITKTAEYTLLIRRRSVGHIMPGFSLVPTYTVSENIEFPLLLNNVSKKERDNLIADMLARLNIECYARFRPEQLNSEITLRVLIARAFIHRPSAVVLDELPKKVGESEMLDTLSIIKQLSDEFGTAVLAATSNSSVADMCDRKIHLCNGHIVEHIPVSVIQRSVLAEALPWGR